MKKVEHIEVVEQPRNYGKKLYAPLCEGAVEICALTRHRSLTPSDIEHIKNLGIEVHRMVKIDGEMVRAEIL